MTSHDPEPPNERSAVTRPWPLASQSPMFAEPPRPMPQGMSTRFGFFDAPATESRPVRIVDGFEPFAAYVRAQGADPADLAADVSALWSFLVGRVDVLASSELADAAARFAGNTVAVAHPAATWRTTPEPEVGTSTMSIPVASLLRSMVEHPERRDEFLRLLAEWPQSGLDDRELQALASDPAVPELSLPAEPFVRPAFPPQEFRDESGSVIPYGERWPEGPPDDAYSRVTYPERFAPLLRDLDALADHLEARYVVDVDRSVADDGTRTVRFRPAAGASVTLTATAESVELSAGALFRDRMPDCTCDACDETAASAADALEVTLLGIAAGGLQERYPVGARGWLHTRLHGDGGGRSGGGAPDPGLTRDALADAEAALRDLPGGWWPAWPLRA